MKATPLTDLVLLFARARTHQHRETALRHATLSSRFDEEQMAELRKLLSEAACTRENVHALRPITLPTTECPSLVVLESGDAPMLPPETWANISEWVEGWNRADELRLNQLRPPGAMLLTGPTGTGKTMLTKSIAGSLKGRTAVVLDAHAVVDSHMGATGEAMAKAFRAAANSASLLVIEEIDGIASHRGGDGSGACRENNRITIALMRLIETAPMPVIATTNRPDELDAALLRRFDFQLEIAPLDEDSRRVILQKLLGGAAPPADLIALPLHQSVPRVDRLKRQKYLAANAA